ncbi:hypothetical protein BJX66DRAFT_113837 [Aspergillus keveii]|uniref:Uncharacterized protein n=1 Tax=Aspergillus keveii TaxID=714993 RepID=A0ABR4GDR7_9EURO
MGGKRRRVDDKESMEREDRGGKRKRRRRQEKTKRGKRAGLSTTARRTRGRAEGTRRDGERGQLTEATRTKVQVSSSPIRWYHPQSQTQCSVRSVVVLILWMRCPAWPEWANFIQLCLYLSKFQSRHPGVASTVQQTQTWLIPGSSRTSPLLHRRPPWHHKCQQRYSVVEREECIKKKHFPHSDPHDFHPTLLSTSEDAVLEHHHNLRSISVFIVGTGSNVYSSSSYSGAAA